MKRNLLYAICPIILLSAFLLIMCGDIPINPADDPNNVRATVIIMNGTGTGIVYQNQAIQLGIIIRYPDMIKKARVMYSDNLSGDTLYSTFLPGENFDTLLTTHTFETTGKKTINVDVDLINGTIKQFSYDIEIVARQLTVSFDTLPQLSDTITTGIPDTMFFSASTDPAGGAIVFTAESNPALDSTALKISSTGSRACVIVTALRDSTYDITVTAKSGTASKSAVVTLKSETIINFREASSTANLSIGSSDTLTFIIDKSATDTIKNILFLNEASFKTGELIPVIKGKDTTCFTFTPSEMKVYDFSFEITVNNKKDTIIYSISVTAGTSADTTKPVISLVNPLNDSSKVSSPSLNFEISCTDSSGISTVACTIGTTSIPVAKGTGNLFIASISGLAQGPNTIVFTATDSSSNVSEKTVTIIYNPLLEDNVPPAVRLMNPAVNESAVFKDSITIILSCADQNGIASVTCSHSGTAVSVVNSADSLYSALVTGLKYGVDTITFTVTDKSANTNKKEFPVIVKYTKFAVTYNGNNTNVTGDVPVDAAAYEAGDSATIAAQGTLALKGYDFTGWDTIANGSGNFQAANKMVISDKNITFYAQWTLKPYLINYVLNEGTNNAANPATYTIETPTFELGNPVKDGYAFDGWYSNTEFTGDKVISITQGSAGNISLHAKWILIPTFTVTYNGNNTNVTGDVPVDAAKYETGDSATVAAPGTLALAGFTFTGWDTIANGSGKFQAATKLEIGDKNITFYAQWTKNNVAPIIEKQPVSISVNKGTSATFTIELNSEDVYPVPTIKWIKNDVDTIPNTNSLSYTISAVTTADDGAKYHAVVTNIAGSVTSEDATLTINPIIPVLGTLPSVSVNKGNRATFTITMNDDVFPAPTIKWFKNNTEVSSGTSLSYTTPNTTYADDQSKFKVVVNSGNSTVESNFALLTVLDVTIPEITLSGANPMVILLGNSFAEPGYSASDDNDGNITSSVTVTGAPNSSTPVGRYTVTYKVSDQAGNRATNKTRIVCVEGWVQMPTAITTDGAGFKTALGNDSVLYILHDSKLEMLEGTSFTELPALPSNYGTFRISRDGTKPYYLTSEWGNPETTGARLFSFNGSWQQMGTFMPWDVFTPSLAVGPDGLILTTRIGSGNEPVISKYSSTSWTALGEISSDVGIIDNNGFNDKYLTITDAGTPYYIGRYLDCLKYNNSSWVSAFGTDSKISSSTDPKNIQIVSSGNTVYAGYSEFQPYCYRLDGNGWTMLQSLGFNPGEGFSLNTSSDHFLYAAYNDGNDIKVGRYNSSSIQPENVPSIGPRTAFSGTNCTALSIEAGPKVCYVVYQQDQDKIIVWQYHKQ